MRQVTTILTILTLLTGLKVWGQVDTANCTSKFDSVSNRQVYILVDNMPEFIGGQKAMFDFLAKNLKYPRHMCIEGVVYISFIVEPNGQLTDKKIIRGIEALADKEALSVLDKMPDWTPGTCNGQAVSVETILPIKFRIHR